MSYSLLDISLNYWKDLTPFFLSMEMFNKAVNISNDPWKMSPINQFPQDAKKLKEN